MLKTIIGYWRAALTLLLSLGASLVTFLLMRSGQNRKDAKEAKKQAERVIEIAEKHKEIDREFDKRTEDLAHEIEKKKTSSELSNPNDW